MKKIFISIILFIFLFNLALALPIDDAKIVVDNFYKYSQEKNVDEYINLFDKDYLIGLYGNDYKNYFTEGFNLIDIEKYNLEFQYYTESNDSLSLFYRLETTSILDGEKTKIENDLVALFIKKDKLYLKYILPQSIFIEQMNKEVILDSAMVAVLEENNDIKSEAIANGISLVDMESLIDDYYAHESKAKLIWAWIALILIIFISLGIWKKDYLIKHKFFKQTHKKTKEIYNKIKNKQHNKLKKSKK